MVNTAAPMPFGRQFDPYPCQCGAFKFTVQPGDAVPRMMWSCGPSNEFPSSARSFDSDLMGTITIRYSSNVATDAKKYEPVNLCVVSSKKSFQSALLILVSFDVLNLLMQTIFFNPNRTYFKYILKKKLNELLR